MNFQGPGTGRTQPDATVEPTVSEKTLYMSVSYLTMPNQNGVVS